MDTIPIKQLKGADMDTESVATPPTQSTVEYITDAPIRVEGLDDLPKKGQSGKLYRVAATRDYYRWNGKAYEQLPSYVAFKWRPFTQIMGPLATLLERARRFDWVWSRHSVHVKYINIRVSMDTGDVLITDNSGHPITIEELQYQNPRISQLLKQKN